ncbi:MAG TPA: diaminopimelate epimerase [Actinomycetota bacterium]
MSELRFSKYQGTGNDFVMVIDLDDERPLQPQEIGGLCHRRTGIGADGLIRIVGSDRLGASFFMDYANADGSPAEMCGNGIRCVGALLHARGLLAPDVTEVDVATRAGVKHLRLTIGDSGTVDRVTVGMGEANFTKAAIPMHGPAWETFLRQPFEVGPGMELTVSAVSMGNPHLVLFVDEHPDRYHVSHIGPSMERHELFPQHTNVEFAHVTDDGIDVRVWERGSGETMACGSGACAVAVAANEADLAPATVQIRFPGGVVHVERTPGQVWLTGEVQHVFDGTIDLDRLARG